MMENRYQLNCVPENTPLMQSLRTFLMQKGHEQLNIFEQNFVGDSIDFELAFSLFTPISKEFYNELRNVSFSKERAIKKVFSLTLNKFEIEQRAVEAVLLNKHLVIKFIEEEIINEGSQ